MTMGGGRAQFHAADRVRARRRLQTLDALDVRANVGQHHRFVVECIGGRQDRAAPPEAARGHRLGHRVHVGGVVEMLVREHDRVEFPRIAGRNVRKRAYERAGARIHVDLRPAKAHPHAARCAQLARDDEARSAAPEKEDRRGHAVTFGPRRAQPSATPGPGAAGTCRRAPAPMDGRASARARSRRRCGSPPRSADCPCSSPRGPAARRRCRP